MRGWLDFYRREPWGFPVADLQQARLMALVAAAAGSRDVNHQDFRLVPPAEDPAAEPTPAETAEALQALGL